MDVVSFFIFDNLFWDILLYYDLYLSGESVVNMETDSCMDENAYFITYTLRLWVCICLRE